jgi:hypothetical protein
MLRLKVYQESKENYRHFSDTGAAAISGITNGLRADAS